ncbi:MAG: hypothetical protein K9G44_04945 [Melioribacteraceae bacterium]|nr:hypothetical protein [Melioribacteraceae bacterium]
MDIQTIIPSVDPISLPAPYWLFKLLLIVTFVLHIIAMNIVFGGSIIAYVAKLKGKTNDNFKKLYSDLAKKLPTFLAATITLGVAPLLFLQVIYGQYFYTSSAIIGWPWFLVIILLIIAYYGFYIIAFKGSENNKYLGWILLLSSFCIVLIGFIYSNNLTLMSTPQFWSQKYFRDPTGMNLNLNEYTLIPRYLHFVTAAIAVGGLFVAILGVFKWGAEKDYAKFLINFGGKWFTYATMLQFVVGILYLIILPKEQMMTFMGENIFATVSFLVALTAALGSIFIIFSSTKNEDPRKGIYIGTSLLVLVLVFMSIMRDSLRDSYLSEYFNPDLFLTATQWDVLGIFLFLFLGGIALWIFMLKVYFRKPNFN